MQVRQTPWVPRQPVFKLRAKVTIGVILPLIIILGVFTAIDYTRRRDSMLTNLSILASETNQLIENSLVTDMLEWDTRGIRDMLSTFGGQEIIRDINLMNLTGQIIFSHNSENEGKVLSNQDPTCQPCHRLDKNERPGSMVVQLSDGERVFRSMKPIENRTECHTCHDSSQRINGLLLTDIRMAPIEEPISADLREIIIWWVVTIMVTAIIANVVVSQAVTRRLERLAQAFTRFEHGELIHPDFKQGQDEISQLLSAFNTMINRIQSKTEENRILTENLRHQSEQRGELLKGLISAQENERKRVARELHDELGQSLSSIALQVEIAKKSLPTREDWATAHLNRIRALTLETSNRMYELIHALRPSVLDDLGLVAAVREITEKLFIDSEIKIDIKSHNLDGRLSPEVEIALYRIYQEALTNVWRHSGASQLSISLDCFDTAFKGEIIDDGIGFDAHSVDWDGTSSQGLGLMGIRERALQCGGQIDIVSQPGSGTQIIIQIPLDGDRCE